MLLNKLSSFNLIHSKSFSSKTITKSTSLLFFKPEVQQLLTNLIRLDINKVFKKQKYAQELKPHEYKFLTTEEVNKLKEKAELRALNRLQIPPVVPPRDDSKVEILSDDKEILGHDISSYVFTDITFGISDAKRIIVVREPSGILREANTNERHRMNSAYFSRPGASYKHPEMFNEENLQSLLNRKEYIFVLDRACAHYEPDDQLYHNILDSTFTHINNNNSFEVLRSTRHFGSLVFYLTHNKIIDNLLLHNLQCNMIEDAIWLIQLYKIINQDSNCCLNIQIEKNNLNSYVEYIKSYIEIDSVRKDHLLQALETYKDVFSVSGDKQEN